MSFLAQVGHEHSYLPELIANGDLEGIILQVARGSPRNVSEIAARGGFVLVDPQTYKLGDVNVALTERMATQPFVEFWPSVSRVGDRSTRLPFVEKVIEVELSQGATDLVSPYLFVEDASGPALEYTLEMAEDVRQLAGPSRRIWTGIYVAGSEIKRPSRVDELLNHITSSSTDHCYLIVDPEQTGNGPTSDTELILALRKVVGVLESNDIRVLLGYSDPVGLLLMADGLSAFASGIRGSLRKLRMAAQRRTRSGGRSPHSRYYLANLLNFVRVDTELAPALAGLGMAGRPPCNCRYCDGNLARFSSEGQFDRSDGNRHYMARLTEDARALGEQVTSDRIGQVRQIIAGAAEAYGRLADSGVVLIGESGPGHVEAWQAAFR
jgi:hypothetical protein